MVLGDFDLTTSGRLAELELIFDNYDKNINQSANTRCLLVTVASWQLSLGVC